MTDLARALDVVADRASVAAAPVAVDRLLARLRRRRAARAALASGLAAVAVGAVAVAATSLPGRDPAPPAASPDPTASPTATDGRTVPWPAAVRIAGDVVCGAALPHVSDPDGAADVRLEVAVVDRPVLAGGSLSASANLVVGSTERGLYGRVEGGTELVVVADGVVVAVLESAPGSADVLSLPGPGVTTLATIAGPLLTCDGAALPAGDYEVLAWQTLTQVPGEAVGRDDRAFLGDAEPLRLAGPLAPLRVEPQGTPRAPACGEAFDLTLVDSPIQETTGGVRAVTVVDGTEVDDPTGRYLVVDTAVAPAGGVDRVRGDLVHRTYLVDAAGQVAFWDDDALAVGTDLWSPTDCRTGSRLDGTFRAVSVAVTYAPAGTGLAPVVEVVELPTVLVMAPPDLD